MVSKQIDKHALHVYLDAAAESEERLRDYYRHIQETGADPSEQFRRQYGGVRRLKDMLQRQSDSARGAVSLVFHEEDANLMASCLADALPELDTRLAGRHADGQERAMLEERREFLMHEARSLMTEPLQAILSMDALARLTPSVRALQSRLPSGASMPIGDIRLGDSMPNDASYPGHEQPAQNPHAQQQRNYYPGDPAPVGGMGPGMGPGMGQGVGPGMPMGPGAMPGGSMSGGAMPGGMPGGGMPGGSQFGQPSPYGQFPGNGMGHPGVHPGAGGYQQQPPQQQQPGYPQQGYGPGPGAGPGPMPGYDPMQMHEQMGRGGHPGAGAPSGGLEVVRNHYQQMGGSFRPAAAATAAAAPPVEPAPQGPRVVEPHEYLFDPNLVRDHRVRAQVRLDLQDLVRASANDDMRLSLVHLGSLLEGLLLDFGLRNRKQFGLGDSPDLWDFHALAINALGQSLSADQEPILGILHACRRLLRPSCQVVHPIVTTAKMVEDARRFVEWALQQLGVDGGGGIAAPDMGSSAALWRATKRDQVRS